MCKRVLIDAWPDGLASIAPVDCNDVQPHCRDHSAPYVAAMGRVVSDRDVMHGRSHVTSIEMELTDLSCVRAACERMGWQFMSGQREYKWWGYWVDDGDLPRQLFADGEEGEAEYQRVKAMSEEDRRKHVTAMLGKCDHAIKVPYREGASYPGEIGLVQRGNRFVPLWDYMCDGLGGVRTENGMGGFLQAYAIEKAKAEARKRGKRFTEVRQDNGAIRLEIMA